MNAKWSSKGMVAERRVLSMLIFVVISFFSLQAQTQLVVGNGGGSRETQLVALWTQIETYIHECSQVLDCHLSSATKDQLIFTLSSLKKDKKPLIFLPAGKWNHFPDTLFWSESMPGAQIFVNQKRLVEDKGAALDPIVAKGAYLSDLYELIKFVLLQHKLDEKVSMHVAEWVKQAWNVRMTLLGLRNSGRPGLFKLFSGLKGQFRLTFQSTEYFFDLSRRILKEMKCPKSSELQIVSIASLRWKDFDLNGASKLAGDLTYTCLRNSQIQHIQGEIEIGFDFMSSVESEKIEIDEKSLRVELFDLHEVQ